MALEDRANINETDARIVASFAKSSIELLGNARDAIRETHRKFWHGDRTPEQLLTEMGTDAAEALGKHWATVLWVAEMTALPLPEADREAARLSVIAAHAPLRELTTHPDGTVTVAPQT